jgi:prepilin signal peptidase PulO-like enzyme (type II secretory pathway)
MTGAVLACRAFVLLLGPFAGDYAATLAASWPRAPRPIVGSSRCAMCGASIQPMAQLPVVSWALLRGRRSCCGGRIPIVYPIGEAAGMVTGIAAAVPTTLATEAWIFALGLTLTYIALVDLRRFSIPVWGLAALALEATIALAASPGERLARVATGAALALLLETLRRFWRRGGRPGIGEGDVILTGLLGVVVSWRLAAPMMCVATLAPLAVQYTRRKSGPTPLGFWLNVAAALVLLLVEFNLAGQ